MSLEDYFVSIKKADWRIYDNLVIAMNVINKEHVAKNYYKVKRRDATLQLCKEPQMMRLLLKVAKQRKISLYESSVYIKNAFKSGNYLGIKLLHTESSSG